MSISNLLRATEVCGVVVILPAPEVGMDIGLPVAAVTLVATAVVLAIINHKH